MAEGIRARGDEAEVAELKGRLPAADVVVAWGWKYNAILRKFPRFVYADLGYFRRDEYYRFCVGGWSPHNYLRARDASPHRWARLGISLKPWRVAGSDIIIAGSTQKACTDHGLKYMAWERSAAARLKGCGVNVLYRPKPNDINKERINGIGYDTRPISEALSSAWAVVTHHSNVALDALVAGVPVHAESGAAAAFSVPMDRIVDPPLMDGREQFFADVAWLQWTVDEMRSGECWKHIRKLL